EKVGKGGKRWEKVGKGGKRWERSNTGWRAGMRAGTLDIQVETHNASPAVAGTAEGIRIRIKIKTMYGNFGGRRGQK
ncbi:MAG TPA: hypothetical protein VG167_07730, partial [Verrucomicrobiae bacterium]|nr:hypothetical protein [Verrucomicrobiae bacterium]